MGYYEGQWGLSEWVGMSAMMLLFVGLLVWAVLTSSGKGHRGAGRSGGAADPVAVVAGRLARGEIDVEEFLRVHEVLLSAAPASHLSRKSWSPASVVQHEGHP